jgi:hypothetical protein
MSAPSKTKTAVSSSALEFLADKTGVPFVRLSAYLPPDVDPKDRLAVLDAVIDHLEYLRSLELQ